MKIILQIIIYLLICVNSNCQIYINTKAVLRSEISSYVGCGILMYSEKAKFKIIDDNFKVNNKEFIFYILCPADFGENFWKINSTYILKYSTDTSIINKSCVNKFDRFDKKLKIFGVIFEASKIPNK